MEIQRVKFLLLASALSAPGCTTTVNDNTVQPDGSTGGAQSSGTGGKPSTGGKANTGGNPSTGGAGGTGATDSGSGGTGGGDASAGGKDGSAGGRDGSAGGKDGSAGGRDGGTGGAKTDGAVPTDGGNTCNDDTVEGGVGDCTRFEADSCGFVQFQTAQCTSATTNLKPFVAKLMITCMLNEPSLCDPTATYDCKKKALGLACVDSTANADCDHIHSFCTTADVTECRGYLNGMTAAGRANMVSCMEVDCTLGLYSCVESL